MKKIELPKEIINEIYSRYHNGETIRKLEKQYPYSFTLIQKTIHSYEWESNLLKNYPHIENHHIVAICNKTNKKFIDYSNESGIITKHIAKLYPHEVNNSKYLRKSNEFASGKFWYDKYFTFTHVKNKTTKTCYYCDWSTTDILNSSGSYEKHLKLTHGLTVNEHLKNNEKDKTYFKNIPQLDAIECKICNKKFNIINDKHLSKHNITVSEYRLKYGDNVVSKTVHEKLIKSGKANNRFVIKSKTSKGENDIKDFLIKNGIDVKQSLRKPLNGVEIDIFSHKHRIGIEYNGNLYHTENYGRKNSNYHLNKTKIATNNNIKLIHIFEDEWENKRKIVENKLLHIFHINTGIKLHGRRCIVIEINVDIKRKFLKEYHIQGDDKSNIFIGAYYDQELIAVMTFNNNRNLNKERHHNNNTFELTRYATNSKYIINGIASKMLKFFITQYSPTKIISFADRNWTPNSNNNLYTKLGFTLTKILKPDYQYYNKRLHRSNRLHKFGFGKNAIRKRFPNVYNKNKTEWEMMQELNYDRIWNCGKFKYELIIS